MIFEEGGTVKPSLRDRIQYVVCDDYDNPDELNELHDKKDEAIKRHLEVIQSVLTENIDRPKATD